VLHPDLNKPAPDMAEDEPGTGAIS